MTEQSTHHEAQPQRAPAAQAPHRDHIAWRRTQVARALRALQGVHDAGDKGLSAQEWYEVAGIEWTGKDDRRSNALIGPLAHASKVCAMLGTAWHGIYTTEPTSGDWPGQRRAGPRLGEALKTLREYLQSAEPDPETGPVALKLNALLVVETRVLRDTSIEETRRMLDDPQWWKRPWPYEGDRATPREAITDLWAVSTTRPGAVDARCRAGGQWARTPKPSQDRHGDESDEQRKCAEIHVSRGQIHTVVQDGADDAAAMINAHEQRSRNTAIWKHSFEQLDERELYWVDGLTRRQGQNRTQRAVPQDLRRWATWQVVVEDQKGEEQEQRLVVRPRGRTPQADELSNDGSAASNESVVSITLDSSAPEQAAGTDTVDTPEHRDVHSRGADTDDLRARDHALQDHVGRNETIKTSLDRDTLARGVRGLTEEALGRGRDDGPLEVEQHWVALHAFELFEILTEAIAKATTNEAGEQASDAPGASEDDDDNANACHVLGEHLVRSAQRGADGTWMVEHGTDILAMVRRVTTRSSREGHAEEGMGFDRL